MIVVQHNCRKAYPVTIAAFEAAIQLQAGLICLQEPYVARGFQHPGFAIYWPEEGEQRDRRVAIGVRRDLQDTLNFDLCTDLIDHPYIMVIDIWELDNSAQRKKTRRTRIINCYDNWIGENLVWQGESTRRRRASEDAKWEELLEGRTALVGDFNAHSQMWNLRAGGRRNAAVLESLIENFGLYLNNNTDEATRPKASPGTSIIDLTLTTMEMGPLPAWGVNKEVATGSDHELIEFTWEDQDKRLDGQCREGDAGEDSEVTGWDIKGLIDDKEALEKAEQSWREITAGRPTLTDQCTLGEVEEEAWWVQEMLSTVLNRHAKALRVTSRSKRWWGEEIKKSRRAYAQARRSWRAGLVSAEELKAIRNDYYRGIRKAKRKCWESFLVGADENEPQGGAAATTRCWKALRYASPRTMCTTPALKGLLGRVAVSTEEKEALIREDMFPPRPGGGAQPYVPPGTAHQHVGEAQVYDALFTQAVQKAPGIDRLNFRAMRLLWRWDSVRVVGLARQCIRLGVHPLAWKTARGILLQKPGKPPSEYSKTKGYRVISLLSCLGKVVEKVAAEAISRYCGAKGILHSSQMGSRKQRSAIDAVACLIQEVHEAWGEKRLAGTLLMDVKGAFPNTNPSRLIQCMVEVGIDGDLVSWVASFLSERKVQIVIDGFRCSAQP